MIFSFTYKLSMTTVLYLPVLLLFPAGFGHSMATSTRLDSTDDHYQFVIDMDIFRQLGIDPNSTRSECLNLLSSQSTDALLNLRTSLFIECFKSDLVQGEDEIVSHT